MLRTPWLIILALFFFALPAQAAFTDNGDGTVTDTVTGLMWDKCSMGLSGASCATGSATLYTWKQALAAVVTANAASYKSRTDWRLPNKNELESLTDLTLSSPSINATSFPATASGWYWSSTNYFPDPAYAWLIDFGNGYANSFSKAGSGTYYVRLVRSGQTFDTYDLFGAAPDPFTFTAQTGVGLSTVATSNAITVTGSTSSPTISISGGSYAINGGAYTSASGTVSNGNTVTVRQTSSASYGTLTAATLTIGGVVGTFNVTTLPSVTLSSNSVVSLTVKTAVTASNGGAVGIPAGTGSTGSTISLPMPGGGGAATEVQVSINNKALRVAAIAANTVLTVITATVNGVSTQLLSLTSGAVRVTGNDPATPLLAVGGGAGSNAITVSSDTGSVVFTADITSGQTILAVSYGVVTLPTNSFAQAGAGNGFAAVKDGRIYAGEVATLGSSGKVTGVRLGSPSGGTAIGDPLAAPGVPGLTMGMAVPRLKGTVARISATQDFADVVAAAMGAGYTSQGQSSQGVLRLAFPGGTTHLLPSGAINIDTSRADGVSSTLDGKVEVAKNGVVAGFVPSLADLAQFVGQIAVLDKNASVTLSDSGVIQARIGGVTYVLQPSRVASQGAAATSGFTLDGQGRVVQQDGAGNQQTLFPAFADLTALRSAFSAELAGGGTAKDDGTVSAKIGDKTYTLLPDYNLAPIPAEQIGKKWWMGADGKIYFKSGADKAQGFTVK